MHCVDPACASACMLGAFKKREFGIVTYDVDLCIGCRYCEVACPFNVPKFEWAKALPKMVKCELCNHRLAEGKQPACTEVCPRQAVIFGKREDLLREAQPAPRGAARTSTCQKIYGETRRRRHAVPLPLARGRSRSSACRRSARNRRRRCSAPSSTASTRASPRRSALYGLLGA